MTKTITEYESVCRFSNIDKTKRFEESKEQLIDNVVDHYNQHMKKLLEDNLFLSKENFRESEAVVRAKTESKFKKEIDFGNDSMNEHFFLKCVQKLNESKDIFKDMNRNKSEEIQRKINETFEKSIEVYKRDMNERFDLLKSVEDLELSDRTVRQRSLEVLNTCPLKAPYIFDKYVEAFNTQIILLYEGFKSELITRTEAKQEKFRTALRNALSYYNEVIILVNI